MRQFSTLIRWIPLSLLLLGLIVFFSLGFYRYLSFDSLQQHHQILQQWTAQHYLLVVSIYILIYIIAVAISVPGAIFLTLAGGFLFGIIGGMLYVIFSATIGATLLFLAVQTALGDKLKSKAGSWIVKMEKGFQENAFYYLLILRFIPIFPFWVVNIVSALFRVRLTTFITATFFGIIPGSLVYVSIGSGLSSLFANNQTPNLGVIFTPRILLPLIGLAILSFLPILYKRFKSSKT